MVLLQAISSGDKQIINQICEQNLSESLRDGLDDLMLETTEISVVNPLRDEIGDDFM